MKSRVLMMLIAGWAQESQPVAKPLDMGGAAPAFRLNDHEGKAVRPMPPGEGEWTILAFFPKAATPG